MNNLFKNMNKDNINRLLQSLEANILSYSKNKIILSSVKLDDFIGIILEGHLEIIKNDFYGNKVVIEEIYEGDIFGTISANISMEEYEIITKENTKLIIIELDNIFKYNNYEEYTKIFFQNLLQLFYNKINSFNNRIEILTNKTIRDKLLTYFKINNTNGTNTIYLPFNFSNLADYLAINRSAMSRELKALKEEGFIEIKGKKIKLLYLDNNPIY